MSNGRVRFLFRTNNASNAFTDSPTAAQQAWMREHFSRVMAYTTYWDTKLDWFPNALCYSDSYAIKLNSPLVASNPDWILKDASGNNLYIPYQCANGKCPQYAADIGNTAYTAWWIAQAKSFVQEKRYLGLWVDDVNFNFTVSDGNGNPVAPQDPRTGATMTWTAWRQYFAAFMQALRTALPGVEILENQVWYAGPSDTDASIQAAIQTATEINREGGFNDSGLTGGTGTYSLSALMSYIDIVHGLGSNIVIDDFGTTAAQWEYALAGYYLVTNGADLTGNQNASPSNWWAGWDLDIGAPSGARSSSNGLWQRSFAAGVVYLNEPGAATQTITVPTGYTRIDGSTPATVTLAASQGLVLLTSAATFPGGGTGAATTGTNPPVISSITASPATVTAGQASAVSWVISGATQIDIDNGVGPVTGSSTSITPNATTTYTLTASNSTGSASRTFTIAVQGATAASDDGKGERYFQIRGLDRDGDGTQFQMSDGSGEGGYLAAFDAGSSRGHNTTNSGIPVAEVALIPAIQQEAYIAAPDTGSANAYAVTLSPAPTIVPYSEVVFKALNPNTGASTLAVNGAAAAPLTKNGTAALAAGDIVAGQIITAKFDGTNWQIVAGGGVGGATTGTTSANAQHVQGAYTNAGGSSGTLSVSFPGANGQGNCLIASARSANGNGSCSISDTMGNTWTQLLGVQLGGNTEYSHCWIAPNCKIGSNTVTISDNGTALLLAVDEYSGVATTSPVDASAYTANAQSETVTTTQAGDLLYMMIGLTGNAPGETGSYAERYSSSGSYGGTVRALGVWDTQAGAAGSYSNGWYGGNGGFNYGAVFLLALKNGTTSSTTGNVTATSVGTSVNLPNGQLIVGAGGQSIQPGNLSGDVTTPGSTVATVVALQGRPVNSTAPTAGQVLAYNGTEWAPANASGTGGGASGPVDTVPASGATQTLAWPASGDVLYDITLSANCAISISTPGAPGSLQRMYLIIRPSGFAATLPASSSALVWAGGSVPTPSTSQDTVITFLSSGAAPVFAGI